MIRFSQPLHHAYCISGGKELIPDIFEALLKIGVPVKGNPDFWYATYELLGIEEARGLKEAAGREGVSERRRVFLVVAGGITREAQNALLKLFEDPGKDTQFIVVVPHEEILLPTLRSRLCGLRPSSPTESPSLEKAKEFLSAKTAARLKFIQTLLKKEKGECISFFDALERALAEESRTVENQTALQNVLISKTYVRDRAPSLKLLLEHLALTIPQI